MTSLYFFFQTLFHELFIFILFLNETHPLSAATQLFSASDGSVGVRAYHSFLSLMFLSRTHIRRFSPLPPS